MFISVKYTYLFKILLNTNATVQQLKNEIEKVTCVPEDSQSLWFQGKPLVHNEQILTSCGINDGSQIEMVIRLKGGTHPIGLDEALFSPCLDYDFRNTNDARCTFKRGGIEYKRPIGWYRFAINVQVSICFFLLP